LFVDEGVYEKLRAMRAASLPDETGGILLGYYDLSVKSVVVVDALSAPADSKGSRAAFERGSAGRLKHAGHYLVVSDAGAPLPSGFSLGPLNPFRLKRVADIMSDQAHALRVRTFHLLTTGRGPWRFGVYRDTANRDGTVQIRQVRGKLSTT
jgi:hypothetical protein